MVRTTGGSDDNRARPPEAADASFDEVLRVAIARRGLGLERIKVRLERCGTPVSAATLSYWSSGRSQPERKGSLAALPHLESILELPDGALSTALPAPRERGRGRDVRELAAVWPEEPQARVLGRLDLSWDTELERLSVHDVVTVGADRRERSLLVREVVRARSSGPDRRVVLHCVDDGDAALPDVTPIHGCRRGRTVADPSGTVGTELLLGRPLRRGETAVLEYVVTTRPPRPLETEYVRRLRAPLREHVIEVRFAPDCLPSHCERVDDDQPSRPLRLSPAHSVHLVELNGGPGVRGIRWNWPDAPTGRPDPS
jgi:hypothetical protein